MAYHNSVRFDSIDKGTEFKLPFSSLTFVKKSNSSAKVYNDFDEYLGVDQFKAADHVETVSNGN